MDFYTILTDIGRDKLLQAHAESRCIKLDKIAVGDGGDGYYEPSTEQTELFNEKYRGPINRIYKHPQIPNRLIIENAIPGADGGYYIREAGIFDEDGNLFALAKIPESYKPVQIEGATRDIYINIIIELENTEAVELVIDPNVTVLSSVSLENHNKDPEAHKGLIDVDKVDGFHAGNNANQVAVSNGILCNNLNAELIDGHKIGDDAHNIVILDDNSKIPEIFIPINFPAGFVMSFAGIIPPKGWLICDGREISRKIYSRLFSVIGILFGEGDGITTYNLPDLRGEFIRGWDKSRGIDKNRALGSWQEDMFKAHSHTTQVTNRGATRDGGPHDTSFPPYYAETGAAGGIETRPRNVALLYCIAA